MKLIKVHIQEFLSVRDSNEFAIGDITCLVGKNEAGKTALLQALYRLNPIEGAGSYSVTHDYPRRDVEDYKIEVANGSRQNATVAKATFELSPDDLASVEQAVGKGVLANATFTYSKGYKDSVHFTVSVNEAAKVKELISSGPFTNDIETKLGKCSTLAEITLAIEGTEETEAVQKVKAALADIDAAGGLSHKVLQVLKPRIPKFL